VLGRQVKGQENQVEYKDTLNLPKTSFPMKGNLPEKEKELVKFWDGMDIYAAMRAGKTSRTYVLHDGPPYANGHVHIGTALNKFLKDVVVKYWSMCGYDTPYVPGWDCHGMPIEHNVAKIIREKKQTLDLLRVRKECRAYAENFMAIQREEFKRLGCVGDWQNPYLTMNYAYEARILEAFKTLMEKGYIYRGLRPIHWCPVCKTALANVEVEYDMHDSPSIYVKFPLKGSIPGVSLPTSIIIWTTTPWTLPANVAVAVKDDYDYVAFKTDGDAYVVAEALLSSVSAALCIKDPKVLKRMKGAELEGLKTKPPMSDRDSVVILADFVSLEQGTGVVHIAPGHGYDDYQIGNKYGLDIVSPVDEEGKFTEEVPEYAGMSVFDANPLITDNLTKKGIILASGNITHSYPECWRCESPLIFRAQKQWFLNVEKDDLRQRCLDSTRSINWVPPWSMERMSDALEARPDWCLSRQRAWGVPIPAVHCLDCGEVLLDSELMDRAIALVRREGSDAWFTCDIAKITPESLTCPVCGSRKFEKEKDILDVWFDSSISNLKVVKDAGMPWPADLFLEAVDQHRGWFQLSLIVAVATEDSSPYKACLTHGLVLDAARRKMSKKLGNVTGPEEIWSKYGADILRLWFASVDYTSDMGFGDEVLAPVVDVYRKIRNTFRYMLGNLADYDDTKNKVRYEELGDLEKYILHELQVLTRGVREAYEDFKFFKVYHLIHDFCVTTLSQFYFDIMKDVLYTFAASSRERRGAQTVLYEVLTVLDRLLAPILSFTAEEVWLSIPAGPKENSVLLAGMPEARASWMNEELATRCGKLIDVRNEVLVALERARDKKLIGNALEARVILHTKDESLSGLLKKYSGSLAPLFIVSEVVLAGSLEGMADDACQGQKLDLVVSIGKANGQKCQRCWVYSSSVGESSEYPGVCGKCLTALNEIKKTTKGG
jgi:isoleucyl-tRNA synthetase